MAPPVQTAKQAHHHWNNTSFEYILFMLVELTAQCSWPEKIPQYKFSCPLWGWRHAVPKARVSRPLASQSKIVNDNIVLRVVTYGLFLFRSIFAPSLAHGQFPSLSTPCEGCFDSDRKTASRGLDFVNWNNVSLFLIFPAHFAANTDRHKLFGGWCAHKHTTSFDLFIASDISNFLVDLQWPYLLPPWSGTISLHT